MRASTMQLVTISGMKMPEHQIQPVHVCIHAELHDGDQHRDDQDEYRDARLVRHQVADRRDRGTGQRHHHGGREAQADAVDHRTAHREYRAHAEQLHQPGVLLPHAVVEYILEFLKVISSLLLI